MCRVAFVSHVIGRPLAIVAELEPAGDATDYCGPTSCTLTIHVPGERSVPLLDADDLWEIRHEADALARGHARPRFAA